MPREEIVNQISSLFSGKQVTYDDLFKKKEQPVSGEQLTYDELFGQPAKPLQPTTEEVRPIESRESIVNKLLKNIDYAFVPETAKQATTEVPEFQTELEEIAIKQPELFDTYSKLRKDGLSHEASLRVARYKFSPEQKPKSFLEKMSARFQRGTVGMEMDQLMYDASLGGRPYEEVKAIKDEYERIVQENPIEGKNFLENTLLQTAEIAGPMAEGIRQGLQYGTAAGAAAIVAGQAGPQALIPEEIITAPAAFTAGQTAGAGMAWYKQGTGAMFDALMESGVDRDIATPIAHIAGIPYAIIEFFQVGKIASPIVKKVLGKETSTIVANTLPKVITKLVARFGGQVLQETGEEIAQEAVQIASDEIGKELSNRLRDTDIPHTEINELVGRLTQTGKESAAPLATLLLPGHATTLVSSASGVKKVSNDVKKIAMGTGLNDKEASEVAKKVIIDITKGENFQQSIARHIQEIKVEKPVEKETPAKPEKIEISNFEQYKEAELDRLTDEAEKKKLEENPKQYLEEQISTLEGLIKEEPDLEKIYKPELDNLNDFLQEIEDASAVRSDQEVVTEEGIQPKESKDISSEDIQQPAPEQPSVPGVRQEEKEIVPPEVERVPTEIEKKPLERKFYEELQAASTIEEVAKISTEFSKADDSGEYEISGKYRNDFTNLLEKKNKELQAKVVEEKPVVEKEIEKNKYLKQAKEQPEKIPEIVKELETEREKLTEDVPNEVKMSKNEYLEHLKTSKEDAGVLYEKTIDVKGEKVRASKDAGKALRDVTQKQDTYKKFIDCLRGKQ